MPLRVPLGGDQRLVDQSGQQHLNIVSSQRLVGAHGRRGVEGEAAGEHRQSGQQRRSSSNSRSKLQSTAACIVCCRFGRAVVPALTSPNRWSRSSAS